MIFVRSDLLETSADSAVLGNRVRTMSNAEHMDKREQIDNAKHMDTAEMHAICAANWIGSRDMCCSLLV